MTIAKNSKLSTSKIVVCRLQCNQVCFINFFFCQSDPHTHDSERKRVASQVTGNESQKKKVKVIDISQQQNGESGKRFANHEEETLLFRY